VDYWLSEVQADRPVVTYTGAALTASMRDTWPSTPVVLITRRSIVAGLTEQRRRALLSGTGAYDSVLFKEDLNKGEELDHARQLLVALASGYRALKESPSADWSTLLQLLQAQPEEEESLHEAAPPLLEGTWVTAEVSAWVRQVLFRFPGILHDSMHAATTLGISETCFRERCCDFFRSARYDGVFHQESPRWWKRRILDLATGLALEESCRGPLAEAFGVAFERRFHTSLEPTICVWDGTPVADYVCAVLNRPVRLEHSLRYYPDRRPPVMDPARVSFRAIRESNEFDERFIDAGGAALIPQIEACEDPRGHEGR